MSEGALLSLQLPCRPASAAAARTALAALNGDLHLISPARLADAQLLVTELVTNAARAGGSDTVALEVRASPAVMRVEVHDDGPGFDPAALKGPSPERAGGWGLRIVDVLADRWGADRRAVGTSVWFEIERPQAEAPLPVSGEAPPPPGLEPYG